MTDNTFEDILAFSIDLKKHYEIEFALAGGDPTAHEKYVEYAEAISKIGTVVIVTHGCSFTRDQLLKISELEAVRVQFSVPSLFPNRFKYITGGYELDRLLENIARCRALGVPTSFSAVASDPENIAAEVRGVLDLAKAAKVDSVIFNKFLPAGRGKLYENKMTMSQDKFVSVVRNVAQESNYNDIAIFVSQSPDDVRRGKIEAPKITICFDGSIKYCSMASRTIGHVSERSEKPLLEYRKFWMSGDIDRGCECSKISAPKNSKVGVNEGLGS